jgi:hypothetical protein
MSESRPQKRKVEFIESYWTGGEFGSDYQWNDNHGELVRCKDCKYHDTYDCSITYLTTQKTPNDWFCADGERRENDEG